MASKATRSRWEYMLAYYVCNTIGVACAAFAVGFGSTAEFDLGAWPRTIVGLAIAAIMGIGGEFISRHSKEDSGWANSWFSTNLLAFAYTLAYFFVYATYYVPVLKGLDTPYWVWGGELVLAGIGVIHGLSNKNIRWFTSPFTLLATLHALFVSVILTKTSVNLFGHDLHVAQLACGLGVFWCGSLAIAYKKAELKFPKWNDCKNFDEYAGHAIYRASHEIFFVLAAACAAYVPLINGTLQDAPFYWALEAPVLLAISWRNGNFFKHACAGLMWAAAAFVFVNTPFSGSLPVYTILAVVGVGAALGMAYRFESELPEQFRLPAGVSKERKVLGYAVYLYAAIGCALLIPVKHLGLWDAMPWILGASLVVCAAGIWLRDYFVHIIGVAAAGVGLALFFLHHDTWTWGLVGPVVAFCYALSLSYTKVAEKGGFKRSDFLPIGPEYAVSKLFAERLELTWSWIGFVTLAVASYELLNHEWTVFAWAGIALLGISFGFWMDRSIYRLQGWTVLIAAMVKLLLWDMAASQIVVDWANFVFVWKPQAGMGLFRAGEFAAVSAAWLIFSWVYKHKVDAIDAAEAAANAPVQNVAPSEDDETSGPTGDDFNSKS